MSSPSRPDLLRPSLSDPARLAAAPYSLQAGFFSAFFGGPLASALMLAVNARHLGRLPRDAGWVAVIAAAYIGWLYFAYQTPTGLAFQSALAGVLGSRAMALAERVLALAAFLVGLLLHRREQRSADLFGLKRPNGWVGGLALIAIGFVLTFALRVALE
jgi:hypothetical protein